MSDDLELFDMVAARRFLADFPAHCRRKGLQMYSAGQVSDLSEVIENQHYVAKLGGQSVDLEYDDTNRWNSFCTVHSAIPCEHAFAAMHALVLEYNNALVQRLSSMHSGQQAVAIKRAQSAIEDQSDLARKLFLAVGRPLTREEIQYLARVHRVYGRCLETKVIHSWEFEQLGFWTGYGRLDIWPEFPASEHEFWLYVAHAAQEAGHRIPEFMVPVTDFDVLKEKFSAWRRRKEIEQWTLNLTSYHDDFGKHGTARETLAETDLRIVVGENALRLAWKRPAQAEFEPLRKTHLRKLQYDRSSVRFTLEGEIIWSSLSSRMGYEGHFPWANSERAAREALAKLVQLSILDSRFVDESGRVLERPAEPLKWTVEFGRANPNPASTPGADEAADYRITLVRADGSPAPHILAVLPAKAPFYLSPAAIYRGPSSPPPFLQVNKSNVIPFSVIETNKGVELLEHLEIELPERLRKRIRTLICHVVISCRLVPLYLGSKTEDCVFSVEAGADDGHRMRWNAFAWYASDRATRAGTGGSELVTYDTSRMDLVPPLFESLDAKNANHDGPSLRVTKAFPETFAAWLRTVPPEIEVRLEGDLASFANAEVSGHVKLQVQETVIDWFDLSVLVDVTDATLTPEEIRLLLNARGRFVRLQGKGWKRLHFDLSEEEDERLARLGLSPRELSAEPQRLHTLQLADPSARTFLPAEQVERVQRRATEIKARVAPELPDGIKAQFRTYQTEGYHFLAYLSANHFGGILADDMGLGKTVQALAWLLYLRAQPPAQPRSPRGKAPDAPAPALVVCPKSVMDNWHAEAERFAPDLRVRVWPASSLPLLRKQLHAADLHVLNYNQLRSLGESLQPIPWLAVILDEGQYIKNPNSQTAQIARALVAQNRLVLTGTPIENRLLDLWSLMSFAMPGVLGSHAQFARLYDVKDDPLARKRLSARVRPFLLRRTKAQVATDLPDRIEEDLFCEIEGEQQTLYRAELKNAQQRLLRISTQKELAEQQFSFLTSLLRLRQICCHPKLVKPDSKAASAKLEALLEQLEPIMEEGQKVLVFSQFVELLNLVQPELRARGWRHFYLSGQTENRGNLVKEFQASEGAAVFLVSLKAGGFGLNLTAASYVVLFDPWWNPAVENQAIDRTHRIGQVNKVIAYRLLIKNSIEEKIRALQKTKKALAEEVLGEEKFSQSLTLDDLRFLFSD